MRESKHHPGRIFFCATENLEVGPLPVRSCFTFNKLNSSVVCLVAFVRDLFRWDMVRFIGYWVWYTLGGSAMSMREDNAVLYLYWDLHAINLVTSQTWLYYFSFDSFWGFKFSTFIQQYLQEWKEAKQLKKQGQGIQKGLLNPDRHWSAISLRHWSVRHG